MDFPEYSFPVHLCPHNRQRDKRRFAFAGYGSYSQVNTCPNKPGKDFTTKCFPQKGLGVIKGLHSILPPLPLYDEPIEVDHTHDSILGLECYDDAIESMFEFLCGISSAKRELERNKNRFIQLKKQSITEISQFKEKFNECKELVDACLREPDNTEYKEKLREILPVWMLSLHRNFSKTSKALNDNCLMGFNQDFYQGLMCHSQNLSATTLYHAAGNNFRDIYMSEVFLDESVLPCAQQICKTTLDESVFQLKCSKKGLLCARQKKECILFRFEKKRRHLGICNTASLDSGQELSDIEFSPYNTEEILLSGNKGDIGLWNIKSGCHSLLQKKPNTDCKSSWTSSHFSGHPRQIVVTDSSSVYMFDHRDNFDKGVKLFNVSGSYTKKNLEQVRATISLGVAHFPYHVVATDLSLFLVDQRFPGTPVLNWSSESMSPPQVLQSIQNGEDGEILIFAGTQQPAEIVCYPLNLANGCAPVSRTLPWHAGKLGDIFWNEHILHRSEGFDIDKHFQSSLSGLTVIKHPAENHRFTVFQTDGYGDIFFQKIAFTPDSKDSPGCYSLVPPSADESSAGDQRITKFLSSLDATRHNLSGGCTSNVSDGDKCFKKIAFSPDSEDSPECYSPVPPSADESSADDQRITKFPSSSDARHNLSDGSTSSDSDGGDEFSLKNSMVLSLLKGVSESSSLKVSESSSSKVSKSSSSKVSESSSSKKKYENKGSTFKEFKDYVCGHKSSLKVNLPTRECNTRLLLALKNNEDIKEVLQEREEDHFEKSQILENYLTPSKSKRKCIREEDSEED